MGGIGGQELFLLFLVVLLIFGPKKIPEVARGLGKGLRELRRLSTDLQREVNLASALEDDEKRIAPKEPDPAPGPPPGPPEAPKSDDSPPRDDPG